jgi:excisionase family DNA binding protein
MTTDQNVNTIPVDLQESAKLLSLISSQFVSIPQAAKMTGFTRGYIVQLLKAGKLMGARIGASARIHSFSITELLKGPKIKYDNFF